jgi:hypothetical protein
MKKLLHLIEVIMGIYFGAFILIVITLYKPEWTRNWLYTSNAFPQNIQTIFTVLAPLATLMLAYAAFKTILSSNEREEQRRQEERRIREEERERDFKRRCLDDIQNWAEKGISFLTEGVSRYGFVKEESLKVLSPLRAMNKWVMDASRIFAEDDKKALLKKVDEAAENLKQYCEVLKKGKLSSEGVIQRYNQCLKSFTEVLERIADVKIKLKL